MKKVSIAVVVFVGWLALLQGTQARATEKVVPAVHDALAYAPPGGVQLSGPIGESIAICKHGRMLGQSVPDLIQPFAARSLDKWWRCEFWGKWYTSAALAYRYEADPALRAILEDAARQLIGTQATNGSITSYKPAAELGDWDVWGRKYSLLGLLAHYELSRDARSLEAACRLADHTLSQLGPGKRSIVTVGWWNGMASSSILEPMVLLYRQTGEPRHLEFAQDIVRQWETPKGPDLVRKALAGASVFQMFPGPDPSKPGYMSGGSSKAYEMMSCYEGLLELYRVTGEPRYRQAAEQVFANIRETEITVLGSGSSWERWCNGRRRQAEPVPEWMETCVTVTWMKFAAQLLRLTGEPAYADEIERSTYNALLAAQKADGTWWCHYNPLEGTREAAPEHCEMHMNCCVANGPRGLMLLPALAVMSNHEGPVVNFFERAQATTRLPSGKSARLSIQSDYPRSGLIEIGVQPEQAEKFTLSVRIPAWSRTTRVEINGKSVPGIQPGSYARLSRKWRAGDVVRLTLDFGVRQESEPGGSGRIALLRGPVVFALDKRITEPHPGAGKGTLSAQRLSQAKVFQTSPGIHIGLEVPLEAAGKTVTLRLCDYASAGSTWSADSTLRVWLPQPLDLEDPFAGLQQPKPE